MSAGERRRRRTSPLAIRRPFLAALSTTVPSFAPAPKSSCTGSNVARATLPRARRSDTSWASVCGDEGWACGGVA